MIMQQQLVHGRRMLRAILGKEGATQGLGEAQRSGKKR